MTPKFGHVRNPLTVIAIFASIAEVSGVVAISGLDIEVQKVYVYFLMVFPLVLVQLFFATLWLDHSVLYAPSDFRNDSSFLGLLRRDPNTPSVSADVIDDSTQEASAKPTPVTSASEPRIEAAQLESEHDGDNAHQQSLNAPAATVDKRTLNFIRSGRHINAVARKLKERFSAPYSLSQSPKAMPGLHFDIVLTNSEWNYVGKVAVVTNSNWEQFLVDAQHWLTKVSAFRDALETKDALRLQGVFGLVYSLDSISEDSLTKLQMHLNGIQLQYPFGSYIELFNLADLQA